MDNNGCFPNLLGVRIPLDGKYRSDEITVKEADDWPYSLPPKEDVRMVEIVILVLTVIALLLSIAVSVKQLSSKD